jgi:hypothetical protein
MVQEVEHVVMLPRSQAMQTSTHCFMFFGLKSAYCFLAHCRRLASGSDASFQHPASPHRMKSETMSFHGRSFRWPDNEPAMLTIDSASRKALR